MYSTNFSSLGCSKIKTAHCFFQEKCLYLLCWVFCCILFCCRTFCQHYSVGLFVVCTLCCPTFCQGDFLDTEFLLRPFGLATVEKLSTIIKQYLQKTSLLMGMWISFFLFSFLNVIFHGKRESRTYEIDYFWLWLRQSPKLLAAVPLYYILGLLDVNLLRSSGQVWISSAGAIQQSRQILTGPSSQSTGGALHTAGFALQSQHSGDWHKSNRAKFPTTSQMIEVICNDRLGKKVRVKCK